MRINHLEILLDIKQTLREMQIESSSKKKKKILQKIFILIDDAIRAGNIDKDLEKIERFNSVVAKIIALIIKFLGIPTNLF